jgi:hypothetical protein
MVGFINNGNFRITTNSFHVVFSAMNFTFLQIFWIILIIIAIASIRRIAAQKGWTLKNFIRVEDVDDDKNES